MDLEQRVQALEQEVQLLKSQIQATLLEIQEHLLTNTHSTLRAEDALPSPTGVPQRAAPRVDAALDAFGEAPAMPSPVKRVSFNQIEDEPDEPDEPAEPAVKVNAVRPGQPAQRPARKPEPPPPARQETTNAASPNWSNMADMEEWTIGKIEKMGVKRTRDLIKMYADKGRFTDEIRDMLLQFVMLYAEDHRPAYRQEPPPPPVPNREARRAAPRPQANGTGRENGGNNRRPVEQPEPAHPAAPLPEPPKPETHEEPEHNLVLKLIAGVQNAGAGVKWKKNNG